ncbi:MAG TPA: hypothetical protein VN914_01370 [Polyangia bacterium]|nr:hypothetical protein [Polyangia bacterium]
MTRDDPELLAAVDHALAGDWQRAHEIVQEREGEPIADWIHGAAHWMEGDLSNARYWFGQAGREMSRYATVEEALRAIRKALTG